jgi:hypothetical protein
MTCTQRILAVSALFVLTALQFGCGEETNAPEVKLTASTAISQDSSAHVHSASIPFADISATPANDVYQYRSDITNSHSHVIALSKQQMIDLNSGMLLSLASSTPSSGASHTHTWNFQGGAVLYDKYCYNCHSNDKRGTSPMNVSFTASQTSAEINPSGAPLSTSAAATPDPNF